MKTVIAQKISDALISWRDAETVHLIEFPFAPKTKGQGANKRPETKTFEQMVTEVAQEQISHKAEDKCLGTRIAFHVTKRNQDLDNCVKPIWDALKGIAFADDKVMDYVEVLRVKADLKSDERFIVEILRPVEKREPWI